MTTAAPPAGACQWDEERDTWGSWWLAYAVIGERVKNGEPVPDFLLGGKRKGETKMARQCEVCETPLVRRAGENSKRWASRKVCGRECYRIARAPVEANPGRTCEVCSGLLVRRHKENDTQWLGRRFCSQRCSGIGSQSRGSNKGARFCGSCRARMTPEEIALGGKTCGRETCDSPDDGPPWPELDGTEPRGFGAHELNFRQGPLVTLPMPEPNRTVGGVGSAWMAR